MSADQGVICVKNHIDTIIQDPRLTEKVAWNRHYFEPNEFVVREGESGDSLFFIESGQLRVSGHVELGNKQGISPGIADLFTGGIFGEICLYESHIRNASVITVTETTLLELDGKRLSVYLDDNPVTGYLFYKSLFEIMISRLNRANQRVENLLAWGLKAHGIEKYL